MRLTRRSAHLFLSVGLMLSIVTMARATASDTDTILLQRQGLTNLIQYMDARPELFDRDTKKNRLLNRLERQKTLDVWTLYLDYMTTVRTLADQSRDYLSLSGERRQARLHQHILAFNTHYRFGLEMIKRIDRDPELVNWLNTPHPEDNLPENFYRRFSGELLSDWMTDLYDTLNAGFRSRSDFAETAFIEEDQKSIGSINRAAILTSHTYRLIRRTAYKTYYPLQKGLARGMGKVKLWRFNKTLITPVQALDFSRSFDPGDFYLTRKEWRLTNVGIPGFWTHSALYIGTPQERATYFDTPEVQHWLDEQGFDSLESMLNSISSVYASHPGSDDMGQIRVLEALDAGVIFNSIQTSLQADGAAVFRPKTTRLEKAKAIVGAFHYAGRPYDFHFDFDSDTALVCSELIYKAYQPSEQQTGVAFPLNRAVGRKMLTPNEIARWYEQTADTRQQQIELVLFIDSNERDGVAFQGTKTSFMGSWQRSDWYFLQQPTREDGTLASTVSN